MSFVALVSYGLAVTHSFTVWLCFLCWFWFKPVFEMFPQKQGQTEHVFFQKEPTNVFVCFVLFMLHCDENVRLEIQNK